MLMLNRAFFSLQLNWIPTWIALGNLFLNAVLDYVLAKSLGVWGIPLATAICNVAATWALIVALRRRIHRLGGTAIASTVARVLVASGAVAATSWATWRLLDAALGRSFPAQVVSLGAAARGGRRRLRRRLPPSAGARARRGHRAAAPPAADVTPITAAAGSAASRADAAAGDRSSSEAS
jgi:hypothetical protein